MNHSSRPDAPSARASLGRAAHKAAYDRETIDAIVDATAHCHLGYVLPDGQPIVVPTLQARRGDHLYLHASSGGRMALAAPAGWPVCVTVTLLDELVLARSGFHHSVNHRSVVVLGDAEVVADDDERLAALEAITESAVPGRWSEARPPNKRELQATVVVRVPLDEASAKIRTGPPVDEPEDLDLDIWAGLVPVRSAYGVPVPSPDLAEGIELSSSAVALAAGAGARLVLEVHPGELAVWRLPADADVPDVVADLFGDGPISITRTDAELSVVLPAGSLPDGATAESGWRALSVAGPLDFSLTGVLARLAGPLAEAAIPIFVVSTYDTDWLLVRTDDLERATARLRYAGHDVRASAGG